MKHFPFYQIGQTLLKHKLAPSLVIMQVAIGVAILLNASFMIQNKLDIVNSPTGIAHEDNVMMSVVSHLPEGDHAFQINQQKQIENAIASISGVEFVGAIDSIPLSNSGSSSSIYMDPPGPERNSVKVVAGQYIAAKSVVKAYELKIIEGRDFNEAEYAEINVTEGEEFIKKGTSTIIPLALARKLFPSDKQYVGKTIYWGETPLQIVGVVNQLSAFFAATGNGSEQYSFIIPARLTYYPFFGYVTRVQAGKHDEVMKAIPSVLNKLYNQPVRVKTETVAESRTHIYRSTTGLAWVLVTVCAMLLLITASGMVGMCSLWVSQRTKQIGIRRALGARRIDIMLYFLTENFMIVTLGIVFGILLALGLDQFLHEKFNTPRLPIIYLLCYPMLFWVVGLCASYFPARRASLISPASATRTI